MFDLFTLTQHPMQHTVLPVDFSPFITTSAVALGQIVFVIDNLPPPPQK